MYHTCLMTNTLYITQFIFHEKGRDTLLKKKILYLRKPAKLMLCRNSRTLKPPLFPLITMLLLPPCSSAGFVMNGFAHSPFHQLNYHVWHGARSCTSSNRCNVHINTKKLRSSHRPLNYHIWQYYHFWIFFSCAKLSFLDLVLSHDLKSTEASNSSCAPFMGQFVQCLSI